MADCRPISSEHGLHDTKSTAIDIVFTLLRETMSQPRGAGQKGAAPVTDHLVRAQSPAEFFKEHVEAACVRQRLRVSAPASFYVVNLLTGFAHAGPRDGHVFDTEALGIRLARALQAGGRAARQDLQHVGDTSLFIAGFFADSLRRRLVDVDYYTFVGGRAYGSLGEIDDVRADIFAELADHFVWFVDILADVSERTSMSMANDQDLLRLYEKWLLTGSRRSGELLAERGIVPNTSIAAGPRRLC